MLVLGILWYPFFLLFPITCTFKLIFFNKFMLRLLKIIHEHFFFAACDCFPEGITNDGTCLQEATLTKQLGQCECKNNVFGRQCDQCIPGYWGYRGNPPGECRG